LLEDFLPFNAILCTSPRTLDYGITPLYPTTQRQNTTKTRLLFWYTNVITHEPTSQLTSDETTTHYVRLSLHPRVLSTKQRVGTTLATLDQINHED
jgi:hypothetical protein